MIIHNNTRDLAAKQPARGAGMSIDVLFMCDHKGSRPGAFFRRGIPMRCAKCQAERTKK